jgi:hypothetical protein
MGWLPIFLYPAPYVISMLIGLSAFLFKNKYFHALLCIASCLVHPVMGGLTIMFCSLLVTDFKSSNAMIHLFLWSFVPIILSYLILILSFPQESLDSAEFIDIYINFRHPHHYLISEYLSIKRFFVVLVFPLTVLYLILYQLNSKMAINCLLSLAIIILIPLFHYVFTEVYLVKEAAMLGTPRFFMFGLFFIPFFGVIAAIEILNSARVLRFINYHLYFFNRSLFRFRLLLNRNITLIIILIFLILSNAILKFGTKVFDRVESNEIKFNLTYKNMLDKIQSNDIVMVLDRDSFEFGLRGRINLYASGAFPFLTSKFHEFKNRVELSNACEIAVNKETVTDAAKNYKLDLILMNKSRLLTITEDLILAHSGDFILIDVEKYLQSVND